MVLTNLTYTGNNSEDLARPDEPSDLPVFEPELDRQLLE